MVICEPLSNNSHNILFLEHSIVSLIFKFCKIILLISESLKLYELISILLISLSITSGIFKLKSASFILL